MMLHKAVPALVAAALAITCAAQTVTPSQKEPSQIQPGTDKARAVLVELFTSEGCSSCPPADDLLRAIDGTRTNRGALIVGVSEHVTYWDHGGWKDPFDSDAITERQNEYGQRFHLDSVFTPQMVINGEIQVVGSDGQGLMHAVQKAEMQNGSTVSIVSVRMNGSTLEAVVSFAGELPKHRADIFAAVAEDETTAHVLRGENKGRTLSHASVALAMVKAGKIREAGETTLKIALPNSAMTAEHTRRHLIVWMQEPDLGRVLGVSTGAF